MGLFDSVLGAVIHNGQQPGQAGAGGAGLASLGGLVGLVASNPQLIQAVLGLLSNDGGQGGLAGLVARFEKAGLGDAVRSWIGGGPNQAVSGEQVGAALGGGPLADIAAKLGVNPSDAASQLAQVLPGLVNQLTPDGQAPAGGLGNSADLMGMLGGLLRPSR